MDLIGLASLAFTPQETDENDNDFVAVEKNDVYSAIKTSVSNENDRLQMYIDAKLNNIDKSNVNAFISKYNVNNVTAKAESVEKAAVEDDIVKEEVAVDELKDNIDNAVEITMRINDSLNDIGYNDVNVVNHKVNKESCIKIEFANGLNNIDRAAIDDLLKTYNYVSKSKYKNALYCYKV